MFHAFTGCDTASCIGGRGKKTAWDTWTSYGDVTAAFCALGAMPDPRAVEEWMQPLERFVVSLYDRTSTEVQYISCEKSFFMFNLCLLPSGGTINFLLKYTHTWLMTSNISLICLSARLSI